MSKPLFVLLLLLGVMGTVQAQDDSVLFTVDGQPVQLSEFKYIYSKTNGERADFSKASLDEYLDLYKNFKLKVQRAREMKLDTIPSLQRELAGYRQQLANSYLVDKEVTERLIKEAYDRTLYDVDISHIMVVLSPDAAGKDVKIAEQRLMSLKKKLSEGADFAEIAKLHSEDKNTSAQGGRMGFFTAIFPDGFYNFETAAYNTKEGEVSEIVRTVAGLHLVKVHARRPARGQMEVAHILVRDVNAKEDSPSKVRIDSLYQILKNGADFEALAREQSEDKQTKEKGGYYGFIGIRQVGQAFEEGAFSLEADGDYTKPVKSAVGWHIIKRISKKPVEPFDIAKRRIQTKMQEHQRRTKVPDYNRLNNARKSMIARIKKDGNFRENAGVLTSFINSLDSTFTSYKWKAPKDKPKDMILSLGKDYVQTLGDFQNYCQRNSKRMRLANRMDQGELVRLLYDTYVEEQCMKFEETQLEVKYPEFKSLMREYEEGILLFEATKILVWDKASQDTVGLQEFHRKRAGVYKWNERLRTTRYTLKAGNEGELKKIQKFAKKNDLEAVLAKFNSEDNVMLSAEEKMFEKDKSQMPDGLKADVGTVTKEEVNPRNKSITFYKVEEILPVQQKTLQEARGYVIADYQDYLEKRWLEELRKKYPIKVDNKVFKSLVKK